ncbi:hypothetical protein JCM8547_008240 [Rhodosporidiobolus lusitaniae]
MARSSPTSSPPRQRRPIPSLPPSLPLRLLAALVSLVPFLLHTRTRTALLFPLFSFSPTFEPHVTAALYTALAVLFLANRFARPSSSFSSNGQRWSWRAWWVALGVWEVVSEPLVSVAADALLRLGLEKGVFVGRMAVEGVPTLMLWSWIVGSVVCKERKALLPRSFIPTVYGVSLLPHVQSTLSSWTPLLPECYLRQAHGLLLCLVALLAPSLQPPVQQAHARSPRSFPPRPKKGKQAVSLPSSSRLPSQQTSLRLRILTLGSILALTLLSSLLSTHCPTSPSSLSPSLTLPFSRRPSSSSSRILASRRSVTGWITVAEAGIPVPELDGEEMVFRYLRADHSLLGGLWVGPRRRELLEKKKEEGDDEEVGDEEVVRTAETIYTTFLLQELVRFVPPPPDLPRQKKEQGLIIGLGTGLSARALAAHGVNLTVVEIDPAVYEFARDFFGIEEPTGGAVLEDAVAWVGRQKKDGRGKLYDYIIHDVFTGGSVPSSLFTLEFWSSLHSLLHPSGVIAINFAGALSSPSSKFLLTTLVASFPHCRAIEDVPVTSSSSSPKKGEEDDKDKFRNFVIFCTPSWFSLVDFRDPLPSDYLPIASPRLRRRVFKHFRDNEVDLSPYRFSSTSAPSHSTFSTTGATGGADKVWQEKEKERWMFRRGMEGKVEEMQREEVREHWRLMEKVLPVEDWAQW